MARKRYAQVGLGSRGEMYWEAIADRFADTSELVGVADVNAGRAERVRAALAKRGIDVPVYAADAFDRMLSERKPDVVIVTSKDSTHDHYIVKALDGGSDVITEKPLTIDEVRLQRILDALKRTGRTVRVTFNYRYSPVRMQVKELLASGIIGQVLSVDFNWNLNTDHGADYYRRWHRNKENSGGLLVHKATHHFDLVNWWLDSAPATVAAMGKRDFYTERQAAEYGLEGHSERCHTCPVSGKCNFFLDIAANENLKSLYLDNEQFDGYYRDRCVFSPLIDIEDTMCLVVRYRTGALMSYSLNSFLPWEGYRACFNGAKGRLEHVAQETVYISGDGTVPGEMKHGATTIMVYPHFRKAYNVRIKKSTGGHGGGDDRLLEDIFGTTKRRDPLGQRADHRAGAYSILTGIAANKSIRTGQIVDVASLVTGLA
jgi:predicted dehydrogenase